LVRVFLCCHQRKFEESINDVNNVLDLTILKVFVLDGFIFSFDVALFERDVCVAALTSTPGA